MLLIISVLLATESPALHLSCLFFYFQQSWLTDCYKQQRDSKLDFLIRVNENHCGAKPMYGQEVLDFLTFLPGLRPSPAALNPQGEWGRSGHSSCLLAQQQKECDYWVWSRTVRRAISSIEERLELLSEIIDRWVTGHFSYMIHY